MSQLSELMTLEAYTSGLRHGVYGLWSGKIDAQTAIYSMWLTIERGLTQAWYTGAAECGILADELSGPEMDALASAIHGELDHLENLVYDVVKGNKESGTLLSAWNSRLSMWANRYNDVMSQAKMMACGNKKLKWVMGNTNEHCFDCLSLDGKVKRASTWAASGWAPQSLNLECHGFNCKCRLEVTDEPLTPGKLRKAP